jgi:hypothetical protein
MIEEKKKRKEKEKNQPCKMQTKQNRGYST